MQNTVRSLFQHPKLNRGNKSIIEGKGIDKFKNREGIYDLTQFRIINNRIHIILSEGQNLEGSIKAPKNTKITITTPNHIIESQVHIEYINRVISKVYNTMGDTSIIHTSGSFNKKVSGRSCNIDVLKGNSINIGSSGEALNDNVQGGGYGLNLRNKNSRNDGIRGNAININSQERSMNFNTIKNAFSVNTGTYAEHHSTHGNSIHLNYGPEPMDGLIHSKSKIIKYNNVNSSDIQNLDEFQNSNIPKWVINALRK